MALLSLCCAACDDDAQAADPADLGATVDAAQVVDGPPPDASDPDAAAVDMSAPDGASPDAGPALARCAPGPHEPPTLDAVRTVVTVGDGASENPSHARSFVALLARNDDALFPAFAGLDLATRVPDAALRRLNSGGLSYRALAEDATYACVTGCPAAVEGPALLIVQQGTSDMVNLLVAVSTDPNLADDPDAVLAPYRAEVEAAIAIADDPRFFTERPRVLVVDLPDPTDGTGSLATLGEGQGLPIDEIVDPEAVLALLGAANDAIHDAAERCGAQIVPAHDHFLGHGLEADDPFNPNYDLADPSWWLLSVTEPNLRGAHELRRVTWETLTGEQVEALPALGELPAPGTLPDVPEGAWAVAVTVSSPSEVVNDAPNVATDATRALGPAAEDANDVVALGVVGGYIVVELGATATDGPGDDLVVREAGLMSGGAPEPFRVSVAAEADGPFVQIGDGAGERAFDFAGSGVDAARFVRVESMRLAVDVPRSLGSIYFPGPEIDAVGAVHPAAE